MNRYQGLAQLVEQIKPYHVVEIGTWNGERASWFMGVSDCYYTGFDLFEEATPESDDKELNVKEHASLLQVGNHFELQGFSKWCLIRGNTNVTLHEHIPLFDFCFIDGGHSEATIRNDFEWAIDNITLGGTIVLDDYYYPPRKGFGCNTIVDDSEYEYETFMSDTMPDGGTVSLVRVAT